ncbi:hypothetical protein CRE_16112 [Caenorhabditis remanei]|uniref:Uncharacterized protein n=1 Tax=Caenorhabditis remanei TaxID=31234 RepID=E3MBW6_CAERE|nr:hypothetical protein CRE_16112 [Caenorhabditis remanei]
MAFYIEILQNQERIINDLREALRKCYEELKEVSTELETVTNSRRYVYERERQLKRELEELKEIKASDDQIIRSMKNIIELNLNNIDERMAKNIETFEETVSDLKNEKAECLRKAKEEHEANMEKLNEEQDRRDKELDEILKETKQESEAKQAKIEKENKILKSRQANELVIHQREMNRLVEEHQKETDAIRKEQEAMKNKLEEEKKKNHALEHKLRSEFSAELTEALNRQITLNASNRVLKQFLNITKTVQDASEALKGIELYCSNESPEDFEGEIARDLHELNELKANFKESVFHFQQFVINEQNAHQEILNVCKSYLQKFEESMMNKSLLELCLHLPTAIDNKKTFEIEELRKKAEKLSEEMKIARDEVQTKLEAISTDNQLEILPADMNLEIIIDDLRKELRECKLVLLSVKNENDWFRERLDELKKLIEEMKDLKESNGRIVASVKNKIEVIEKNHEEHIAKIIEEHEEMISVLKNKNAESLKTAKEEHEIKIEIMKKKQDRMLWKIALEEKLRTILVNRQNPLVASAHVFAQFLHITRAVDDTSESLRRICSSESPETFEVEIAVNLNVLKESEIIFRERVFNFQQFVKYEQNAHQEILNVCESYVEKFKELMRNDRLLELCLHLPTAIKNKETVKIEEFVKNAEKLAEEMENTRDEVKIKLEAILLEFQSAEILPNMFGRDLFNLGGDISSILLNKLNNPSACTGMNGGIPTSECKKKLEDVKTEFRSVKNSRDYAWERENKLERELREMKEVKGSNDRIIASMKNNIKINQKNHDEQIAKIIKEHEEKMSVLKENNAECLKTAKEKHKAKMEKLKKEQDRKIKELDEILKKMKQESETKQATIEEEIKILKSRQVNQLVIHQQEMNRLVKEHQTETEAIRKENEAMKNELEEEKNIVIWNKIYDPNNPLNSPMLSIIKSPWMPLTDASEALKGIELYCSNESPENFEGEIARDLHELNVLKANFKAHVFQFRQFVINEQNAHQEILNVCKSYLQDFEELMMNESLIELCLHLPTAIENKKTFDIKKFKKIAEKLSEEMKIARDDVQMELEDISTDSQLEILPADMNSKILPGTFDGNIKKKLLSIEKIRKNPEQLFNNLEELRKRCEALKEVKTELEYCKSYNEVFSIFEIIAVLKNLNTRYLKMEQEEHDVKMKKLKKKQDRKMKELDEILEKTREESEARQAKIKKENKILKSRRANELVIHQQEMNDLVEEHQKKMEKIDRQMEELKKEMEKEKKIYDALEQKQLSEFSTELTKALNRQITLDASNRVLEQFSSIRKTVQDASKTLRRIERCCSNESPENFEGEIASDLHELNELKSNFKNHVLHFKEIVKNEQNGHQEILNVCKSYLQKFEESMMNDSLLELCLHLPTAIENKKTFEIELFRKKAEKLSEEMEIARDEVQMELKAISSDGSWNLRFYLQI